MTTEPKAPAETGLLGYLGILVGGGCLLVSLLGVVNTAFHLHLALRVSGAKTPLPSSWDSVLGLAAAGVLDIIQREAAAKKGEPVDEMKLGGMKQMIEAQVDAESDPFFATARVWDDGIIDPRDTRTVVGMSLSIAHTKPVEGTTSWGVFRH